MQQINDREAALAVLTDPAFTVPPVPPAAGGVAWLRATVARFSSGAVHERRRALAVALVEAIQPESLRAARGMQPVEILAAAVGADGSVLDLVSDVAQAYQPGTGDDSRADLAVDRLVELFGGVRNEPTAARIGLLVQAHQATTVLIDRARHHPVRHVLRDNPPVPTTKRQAVATTAIGGVTIQPGEVVQVRLADDLAFGAGPHSCPGRALALALVEQALEQPNP
jgi:hypothetical protein